MNAADRQLLLQVMRDHASSGLLVRLSWFVGACILVQLVSSHYFSQPLFGEIGLLFLGSTLAYLWCGAFVKNAVQQNSPSNAVLVPGLRRRLMRLTAGMYLAATLVTGALGWLLADRPGCGLLLGAVFSIYVLYAQRYGMLNFLPTVIIVGSLSISSHPVDDLLAAADRIGEPLLSLAGLALLALAGWQAVHALFPQGGDHHWRWYDCQHRQLARASGAALNMEPGGGLRWLAWLRRPYNAALRADSRSGASGRRMMHALGTMGYDGGAIAYMLVSALVMALVGRYLAAKTGAGQMMVCSTIMQGMLMMSVLVYAATVSSQVVRFSGEQSLYRLTPSAPAAAQFNRVLLDTLMFRCLRLWALSLAAIICIDMVILGRLEVRGITVVLGALMLPFAGLLLLLLLLRDYAAVPRQPNGVLAYIALAVVDQMHPGWPASWFAGPGPARPWSRWRRAPGAGPSWHRAAGGPGSVRGRSRTGSANRRAAGRRLRRSVNCAR